MCESLNHSLILLVQNRFIYEWDTLLCVAHTTTGQALAFLLLLLVEQKHKETGITIKCTLLNINLYSIELLYMLVWISAPLWTGVLVPTAGTAALLLMWYCLNKKCNKYNECIYFRFHRNWIPCFFKLYWNLKEFQMRTAWILCGMSKVAKSCCTLDV